MARCSGSPFFSAAGSQPASQRVLCGALKQKKKSSLKYLCKRAIRDGTLRSERVASHLFVFMGELLGVCLQRGHVLVLCQVKHLDGAGIRRTGLLILLLLLICAVFTALQEKKKSHRKAKNCLKVSGLYNRWQEINWNFNNKRKILHGWIIEGIANCIHVAKQLNNLI